MLKRVFSFIKVHFAFLFLVSGGFFFILNEAIEFPVRNFGTKNLRTSVSTKDEFVQAAKNKEDIILQSDIDFSSATVDDYLIPDYTGKIEGNGYALTNGLIQEDPSEHHFFYYLFNDFKGEVSNLVLDNFPFFARTMKDDTPIAPTDAPDVFNITMRNITISDFDITKNIIANDGTADGFNDATSLYLGFFAEEIKNYWLSDFSITNCVFDNNNLEMINRTGEAGTANRIDFYAGYIIGKNEAGKLEKTFMINNDFTNNSIKHLKQDGSNSRGVIEIGTLMGRSNEATVEDNFVNNYNMSNNSFVAGFMRWGALVGYANGIYIFKSYVSNITFHDNYVLIPDVGGLGFSGGFGGTASASSYDYNLDKLVISGTDYSNNTYSTDGSGSSVVNPTDIGGGEMTGVLNSLGSSSKNYFVGTPLETGASTISYINLNDLTPQYWLNTIGFGEDVWNLENLVDANMQITQDDAPGYPIFEKLSYLNTKIVDNGTNFVIDEKNIVNDSVSGIHLKSSFGDDISINNNASNEIDSGINVAWLENKTEAEKTAFFNNNFWLELESTSLNEPIISGNFSNLQTRTYAAPNLEFTNSQIASSNADFQEVEFIKNISNEQFITNKLSDYDTFSVQSSNNFLSMNYEERNILQIPNYISDFNSYLKINLPSTEFSYISQTKTLETQDILVSGELTNLDTSPVALEEPHISITNTFDETNKQIKINLEIDSNDFLFAADAADLIASQLTIHSTFAEFEGSHSKTISLDEFTASGNNLSTDITIQSSVPKEHLNSFYAIEFASNLKYYNDMVYGKEIISNYTFAGDLTNNDVSSVLPYDDTEAFDGLITSELVANNQIKISFRADFLYMFDYEINLIIESEYTTNNISFDPTSSNEVTIEIDSMLIKYYESLEASEQSTFDINEYYSISFDSAKTNEISYLNNLGAFETTTLDEWVSTRTNNQLSIGGLITNTSGTVSSIPLVPRPTLPPITQPTLRPVVRPVEPPTVDPIIPKEVNHFKIYYIIVLILLLIIVLFLIIRGLITIFGSDGKAEIIID